MLSPYRVLDLTDERGEIAGMVLGDLGADVVRVEPPSGSRARRGPAALSEESSDGEAFRFLAFNRNKRSVVLDLSRSSERDLFLRLAAGADFVLESWPDGDLVAAGIGFEELRAVNSTIVHVRLSPYGSDGPRAHWAASDLTIAAMGGPVALQGVAERAPVRLSVPQVWRHAGVEAAVGALVGHARALATGEAQFVDVSAQCAMTWTLLNSMSAAAIQGREFERMGSDLQLGAIRLPLVYECGDGHVVATATGSTVVALLPWMIADGVVGAEWADEDWSNWDMRLHLGGELKQSLASVVDALRRLFRRYPKAALLERGLAAGTAIAPVNTVADVLAFRHLEERGFWSEPALRDGHAARVPGPFVKCSATALRLRRAAPTLDEHGKEIRLAPWAPRPRDRDRSGKSLPFEGLRVADFSWIGVGPVSARYLADHGATVVRVESASRIDHTRTIPPFRNGEIGIDRSQFYGDFNASKLGLALDLKTEAGVDIARRLIAWADVYLESFAPGTIDALGLGYGTARELNPSIIMLSTSLMGQSGPASALAGYGYHAAAVAGFCEVTGWPDLPPSCPWFAYTDTIAPRFVAASLMAAIDHRRRTGEGQHIDAAQLEMSLHFLAPEILEHQKNGFVPTRSGNRARDAAPQGVYPCAGEDRWCAIAVESDPQWRALREALGDPEWARDAELATCQGRLERHDVLDRGIAEWTRLRDGGEVLRVLQAAQVPAGMVQRSGDLLCDPQYLHRGFYRLLEHPEMGEVPYAGHQFRIAGYDSGPRSPAPMLGQHVHEVLHGLLGLTDSKIAEVLAAGALR